MSLNLTLFGKRVAEINNFFFIKTVKQKLFLKIYKLYDKLVKTVILYKRFATKGPPPILGLHG